MADSINQDERRTLSVLAFLFFRMGMDERARGIYEALAELSAPNSSDWRFAHAGMAAVELELGRGRASLEHLKKAIQGGPLATKEAALYLLKAQALWQMGRRDEAQLARDEYLRLAAPQVTKTDVGAKAPTQIVEPK